MKILSVVGARPNFVKIAPLLAAMRAQPGVQSVLVHTGQHYDREMSEFILRDLGVPRPDVELTRFACFRPGNGHEKSAADSVREITCRLKAVMQAERPDAVVVVGDVNSTLAGARAASSLGIPLAHVEAGLRSFDPSMPEEFNRIATDALSDLLFASEPSGVRNLLEEGRAPGKIAFVGNVMIDTLRRFLPRARRATVFSNIGLCTLRPPARYALVTLHRPATVDCPTALRSVWEALLDVAEAIPMIFPVHPRTMKRIREVTADMKTQRGALNRIRLTRPLAYPEFIHLERHAALVITDSGGVQEETTALGIPCLTVRENTERPITILQGTNTLVGSDPERIRRAARSILRGGRIAGRVPESWDGHAAERIVKVLLDRLKRRPTFPASPLPACSIPPNPLPLAKAASLRNS
jgi:UDP-N-acetylglucosamine 2-epimerase (non-hydrolysing)